MPIAPITGGFQERHTEPDELTRSDRARQQQRQQDTEPAAAHQTLTEAAAGQAGDLAEGVDHDV